MHLSLHNNKKKANAIGFKNSRCEKFWKAVKSNARKKFLWKKDNKKKTKKLRIAPVNCIQSPPWGCIYIQKFYTFTHTKQVGFKINKLPVDQSSFPMFFQNQLHRKFGWMISLITLKKGFDYNQKLA